MNNSSTLFEKGGQMGDLMRTYDWESHPLGKPDQWPQSLQTIIRVILKSGHPMFVWWSSDLYMFHNDAYLPALGKKHPQALGARAPQMWSEIWWQIGDIVNRILAGGESFYAEDLLIVMERKGFPEETYWTFSYSAASDDAGSVSGIFCVCNETTEKVLGKRRTQTLKEIAEITQPEQTVEKAVLQACEVLDQTPLDVPFGLIYLLNESGDEARLVGQTASFPRGKAPALVDLTPAVDADPWHLSQVLPTKEKRVFDYPASAVDASVAFARQAVVFPLFKPGTEQVTGFFISALSSRLEFNTEYENFQEMLAVHLATLLATAQLRQEAERQQRRLYALFLNAPAPICVLDGANMVYQVVNSVYQRIFPGRSLLGKPLLEALPELKDTAIPAILRGVYETGEAFVAQEMPVQIARNEGGPLENGFFSFTYQPRRNELGEIDGVLVFAYEVTDQVLARKAIENNAQQLRLLTDALPVSIVYVDSEKRYQFANRLASQWRQSSGGNILGKVVEDVVGKETFQTVARYVDQALAGEEVRFEMPIRYPNGKRTTQSYYVPHLQEGKVVGFYALVIDITEQVEAHQEANRQKLRLTNLFMQAPAAICILAGEDLVFELVNPAYQQLFPGRQLFGNPFLEALPELKGTPTWISLLNVFQTGQSHEEKEILLSVARYENEPLQDFYFRYVQQARYDQDGRIDGVVVFAFEVTEQVRARQKIELSEKSAQALAEELAASNEELAAANEEIMSNNDELSSANSQLVRVNSDLDNFVYTASHDLKAPISNIEGLVKALLRKLPPEEMQKEVNLKLIELILASVERFKKTLGDLSTITQLQREFNQEATPINLAEVVDEVLLDLAAPLQESGARVEIDLKDSLPIVFSRKNLRSIVYNLFSNAVKYRSLERALWIRMTCRLEGNYQVFTIQDNGLGMDLSDSSKIFAMFKRLHDHVEGSGVGLYIVKKMVDNAGGKIEVESQVGQGSTFKVYFKRPGESPVRNNVK